MQEDQEDDYALTVGDQGVEQKGTDQAEDYDGATREHQGASTVLIDQKPAEEGDCHLQES